MTESQQTLDSFGGSGGNNPKRGSEAVDMSGLKKVTETPLAFFAAMGALRLLSRHYDNRVKLRWKTNGHSYLPQIKTEGKEGLTQGDVIEGIESELYSPFSGAKLLYEETAGGIDCDGPLLNGNGNSSIVIEEAGDSEDPEVDINRLLESDDEELMRVISGFCAAVPGDDENEKRGVSVTDLKFTAAGQKILTGAIPRYTEKKSIEEKLEEVSGVGSATADRIVDEKDIESTEDIQELTADELTDINRVGESTAENIIQKFRSGGITQALFEDWGYEDRWKNRENPTVLRLDPYEIRSERTVMGANVLAAEAFPLFTVMPMEETQTVCMINDRSGEVVGYFRYPIWNEWMCIEEIRYILSHPEMRAENPDTEKLEHVEKIYEAEKVCDDNDCRYKKFNPPTRCR